jgi:hypothetical protein
VRRLGLGRVSRSLETLARLEQERRQIRPAGVEAEAVDDASASDHRSAGLP